MILPRPGREGLCAVRRAPCAPGPASWAWAWAWAWATGARRLRRHAPCAVRHAFRTRGPRPEARSPAFTLVEVLLAVLILGLFFSVAFTEQAQSVVLESRARLEAAAAAQVRCRMSEIELQLVKDGYPASDESDSGECCEAFEDERFECSWTIEAIELPSVADLEQSMQEQTTDQTLVATEEGQETSSFAEQAQSFLSMSALKQILPLVQGFLRDAIRKVDVTIFWRYRNRTFDFTVTQYVTNTSQGTLGAVLKADLVQKLMTGGPQAFFDLLYGGGEGDAGTGSGPGSGSDAGKTP